MSTHECQTLMAKEDEKEIYHTSENSQHNEKVIIDSCRRRPDFNDR